MKKYLDALSDGLMLNKLARVGGTDEYVRQLFWYKRIAVFVRGGIWNFIPIFKHLGCYLRGVDGRSVSMRSCFCGKGTTCHDKFLSKYWVH